VVHGAPPPYHPNPWCFAAEAVATRIRGYDI
jgi:hypothetical protein